MVKIQGGRAWTNSIILISVARVRGEPRVHVTKHSLVIPPTPFIGVQVLIMM